MKKRILSMVTAAAITASMAGAIPVSAADKADPGKDWVYTAINKTIDGKQIIIPAININSLDAEAINKKLADEVEEVESSGRYMGLNYTTHRFQNIVSILTETYASNGNVYLSPDMIDLDTGKRVTGDELISMTGLTEKDFYEKQTNAISNALWEAVNEGEHTDLYGSTEDKQKIINETIEYFDVNKSAYINENGNITDIVYIRPTVGTMSIVYSIDTGISVAPAEQEPAITVTLNGTKLEFDQNPVIVDGRTLVPLRKIFEALGASVDWNDGTRTVTSSLGGTTISLTIGSDTMKKNSASVKLDVPAQIIGDRTMVPVRAVAEAFGVNVGWDDSTKTVIIGGEPIVTDRSNESDSVLKEYAKQVTKLTYEDSGKVYTDIRFMLADMTGDGKNELLAIGFDSNNNAVPFVAYEESNGEVKELSYDFTYDKEHIITDQKFDFAPHNGGVYSLIRYEGAVYVANFGVGSKTGFSQRIARYNNGVWEFEELSRTVFDNTGIGENQYMVKGEYVSQEEYENFFNMIEGSEIITKEFVSVDAL